LSFTKHDSDSLRIVQAAFERRCFFYFRSRRYTNVLLDYYWIL